MDGLDLFAWGQGIILCAGAFALACFGISALLWAVSCL